jgi:hypothetical protein
MTEPTKADVLAWFADAAERHDQLIDMLGEVYAGRPLDVAVLRAIHHYLLRWICYEVYLHDGQAAADGVFPAVVTAAYGHGLDPLFALISRAAVGAAAGARRAVPDPGIN